MLDLDALVTDCHAALKEATPQLAVRDVLDRAVSDPAAATAALPVDRAGITRIHVADDLTILSVVWGPEQRIRPHDHGMWAAIGIYGGREENAFFRRAPERGLVESGGKVIDERDVALLGDDTIHSVFNPLGRFTGAIHIYGGDFFTQQRSEWDPETLVEEPRNVARTLQEFEEANRKAGVT